MLMSNIVVGKIGNPWRIIMVADAVVAVWLQLYLVGDVIDRIRLSRPGNDEISFVQVK